MVGRVLPYSDCAFPRQQLADVGVEIDPDRLELCYNPTWFSVHLEPALDPQHLLAAAR